MRRRHGLSFPDWPEADRRAWEAALTAGGDVFDDGSVATQWRPATRADAITGYGYWLQFLIDQDPALFKLDPAKRATPGRLRAYLQALMSRMSATAHVFPSGARQLYVQDGVIVSNPARVVVLVQVFRRHMVQIYGLRISNEARAQKTAALYEFITSERFRTFLDQIETDAANLLELEVKEEKAHRTVWTRRGQLICDIQKAGGNLGFEIGRIIGTAETPD